MEMPGALPGPSITVTGVSGCRGGEHTSQPKDELVEVEGDGMGIVARGSLPGDTGVPLSLSFLVREL